MKAKWITTNEVVNANNVTIPYCSKCKMYAPLVVNATGGAYMMSPYCPFCGSEMTHDVHDNN